MLSLSPLVTFMNCELIKFIFFSDELIEGFEVPVLVFFTASCQPLNGELLSRCKSDLIIVCQEDGLEHILVNHSIENCGIKIPVSGEHIINEARKSKVILFLNITLVTMSNN